MSDQNMQSVEERIEYTNLLLEQIKSQLDEMQERMNAHTSRLGEGLNAAAASASRRRGRR